MIQTLYHPIAKSSLMALYTRQRMWVVQSKETS
nr:MAG TPA: hypothetical protein [Caudoviricetes sp.]DAH53243.1 MAG TPA: hypothetical protein [Caudoviricetes sp.]